MIYLKLMPQKIGVTFTLFKEEKGGGGRGGTTVIFIIHRRQVSTGEKKGRVLATSLALQLYD